MFPQIPNIEEIFFLLLVSTSPTLTSASTLTSTTPLVAIPVVTLTVESASLSAYKSRIG
jgi:hypothetical protein